MFLQEICKIVQKKSQKYKHVLKLQLKKLYFNGLPTFIFSFPALPVITVSTFSDSLSFIPFGQMSQKGQLPKWYMQIIAHVFYDTWACLQSAAYLWDYTQSTYCTQTQTEGQINATQ